MRIPRLARSSGGASQVDYNPRLTQRSFPALRQRLTDSAIARAEQQICKAALVARLPRVTRASNPRSLASRAYLQRKRSTQSSWRQRATTTPVVATTPALRRPSRTRHGTYFRSYQSTPPSSSFAFRCPPSMALQHLLPTSRCGCRATRWRVKW